MLILQLRFYFIFVIFKIDDENSKKQKQKYYFSFFPFFVPFQDFRQTPLDIASYHGYRQIVELLLVMGKANVNSQRAVQFLNFLFFGMKETFLS